MMDVFLLFLKELGTDGVERVRTQLVVTLDDLEDIKLNASVDPNRL